MAAALVRVQTAAGPAWFDVEEGTGAGPEQISRTDGRVVAELNESLENALASARPAAQAVIDAFTAMRPDEVSIEFGLRLDAQAGAVFAKAGIEAHFTVQLTWTSGTDAPSNSQEEPPSGS